MTHRVQEPSTLRLSSHSASSKANLLELGARGPRILKLQRLLRSNRYFVKATGVFDRPTQRAVVKFKQRNKLGTGPALTPKTIQALRGALPGAVPPGARVYHARGTGYYPHNSLLEGGFNDRMGNPLRTLQQYLAGKATYVSVAMDSNAFPYGTKLRIPELEKKYGRRIEFRVVDTGGAFVGRGTSRIDICTGGLRDSLDSTINGSLRLIRA